VDSVLANVLEDTAFLAELPELSGQFPASLVLKGSAGSGAMEVITPLGAGEEMLDHQPKLKEGLENIINKVEMQPEEDAATKRQEKEIIHRQERMVPVHEMCREHLHAVANHHNFESVAAAKLQAVQRDKLDQRSSQAEKESEEQDMEVKSARTLTKGGTVGSEEWRSGI